MFKVIFKLWTYSNADFPQKILKCKPEVKNCPDNLKIMNVIKSYCNNQKYVMIYYLTISKYTRNINVHKRSLMDSGMPKESRERSLRQTPFTMITKITKTTSPKKIDFNQKNNNKKQSNFLYKLDIMQLFIEDTKIFKENKAF